MWLKSPIGIGRSCKGQILPPGGLAPAELTLGATSFPSRLCPLCEKSWGLSSPDLSGHSVPPEVADEALHPHRTHQQQVQLGKQGGLHFNTTKRQSWDENPVPRPPSHKMGGLPGVGFLRIKSLPEQAGKRESRDFQACYLQG